MGREVDLLANYPRAKRNVEARGAGKSERDRAIARRFGKDFFDGERRHGYGGFHYNPRFWQPVIPTLRSHFDLTADSRVLDVGCAKGFMMYDMAQLIPGITVKGIDVSQYAIENAMEDMKPHLRIADARELPFEDDTFDAVISINTVHNLEREHCARALGEIMRVSKGRAFVTVDAYRSDDEKQRMYDWNLTARIIMHVDDWISFFDDVGYTGDYHWFIP